MFSARSLFILFLVAYATEKRITLYIVFAEKSPSLFQIYYTDVYRFSVVVTIIPPESGSFPTSPCRTRCNLVWYGPCYVLRASLLVRIYYRVQMRLTASDRRQLGGRGLRCRCRTRVFCAEHPLCRPFNIFKIKKKGLITCDRGLIFYSTKKYENTYYMTYYIIYTVGF